MNIDQIKAVGHVTTLNGLPVMSSLEIAEITGKNHKHVLRDVRKMLEALKILPNSDLSPQCVETYSQDSYSTAAKALHLRRFGDQEGLQHAISESWLASYAARPHVKARVDKFLTDQANRRGHLRFRFFQ